MSQYYEWDRTPQAQPVDPNGSGATERRIVELQSECKSDLDRAELSALVFLRTLGVSDLHVTIHYVGPDKWQVWAAESIVWCVRRLRAGEYKLALRGWGQLQEYRGRNGGFLPVAISDWPSLIQHAIEARLSGEA